MIKLSKNRGTVPGSTEEALPAIETKKSRRVVPGSEEADSQKPAAKQSLSPASSSIAEVKIMQQEIISVAKLLKDTFSKLNTPDTAGKSQYEKTFGDDLGGSKEFFNVMTHTQKSSGAPAVEEKIKTSPDFLKSLDEITQLGTSGQSSADGIWGPRTNKSINYLYSALYAVATILGNTQLNSELTILHDNILSNSELKSLDNKEKAKKAEAIYGSLKKLSGLVDQASVNLEKSKEYLTQSKPIYDHFAAEKQVKIDPSIANMEVGHGLKVSDLQDLEKVKQYLESSLKIDINDTDKLTKALDSLKANFAKQTRAIGDRK